MRTSTLVVILLLATMAFANESKFKAGLQNLMNM